MDTQNYGLEKVTPALNITFFGYVKYLGVNCFWLLFTEGILQSRSVFPLLFPNLRATLPDFHTRLEVEGRTLLVRRTFQEWHVAWA